MYKIMQRIDKKDDRLYQCFLRLFQYILSTRLSSSDAYFITKYDYKFFAADFQIFAVFQKVEVDSCIYVIKILFNLSPYENEKLDIFSQRTYDIQNFGNETWFISNNEENNDAWPTNVGQFRQAMR